MNNNIYDILASINKITDAVAPVLTESVKPDRTSIADAVVLMESKFKSFKTQLNESYEAYDPGADEDEDEDQIRNGDYVTDKWEDTGEVYKVSNFDVNRCWIGDKEGRGWYIATSRLTPVTNRSKIEQYFDDYDQYGDDDDDDDLELAEANRREYTGRDHVYDADEDEAAAERAIWTKKFNDPDDEYLSRSQKSREPELDESHYSSAMSKKEQHAAVKSLLHARAEHRETNEGITPKSSNFDESDLARISKIRDLDELKSAAIGLISTPSDKPMKPEKIEWFKHSISQKTNTTAVIKLMYDLFLSGEGHGVVGSKGTMKQNAYRDKFVREQATITEKSVSKSQQKFFGMVHAAQKGETPASKEVAKVAKGISKKEATKFASTKQKGLPQHVKESRLMESDDTFNHILHHYSAEVKQFKKGHELDDRLYDALYDYYSEDMPYGIKKARDGDPVTWVSDKFDEDLGLDKTPDMNVELDEIAQLAGLSRDSSNKISQPNQHSALDELFPTPHDDDEYFDPRNPTHFDHDDELDESNSQMDWPEDGPEDEEWVNNIHTGDYVTDRWESNGEVYRVIYSDGKWKCYIGTQHGGGQEIDPSRLVLVTDPAKIAQYFTDADTHTVAAHEIDEAEMEEGNEFSGALAAAKATGHKEFKVAGKQYPVKEDVNINVTGEDALNIIRKLSGMEELSIEPEQSLDDIEFEVDDEAPCSCQDDTLEEERDIEYVNTPAEKIAPLSAAYPSGTDMHRSKKQYSSKPYRGDNPMAESKDDSLWKKYTGLLQGFTK